MGMVEASRLPIIDSQRSKNAGGITKLGRGARILREAILRGDLKPGQKLKQQELADWLGMSATPVREVLRILESEGLLEHTPHKGVYVAEVSPEDSAEITPIRVALEGLAVRMFVSRLDDSDLDVLEELLSEMEEAWRAMDLVRVRRSNYHFHSAIYTGAGSEILRGLIERLWPRFATDLLWMIPGRAEESIEQHRAILEALRKREEHLAVQLMTEHITTAGEQIVEFIGRQSSGRILAPSED
jgi:DNA-binding GntR family transcriptional regulator